MAADVKVGDTNDEGIKESKNERVSQKQIETAIKFLQNPKVKETPLSQRKAFLAKKGLTEDEITKALELSQTANLDKTIFPSQGHPVFPGPPPPPYSLRWRDFLWVALLGGGFGYLLAHLVKQYLLPYILNKENGKDGKFEQLQTSVTELKENLSQTVSGIQDTLDSVQKMLQDQQQKVQAMSLNLSTSQTYLSQSLTESYSLTEIKSELSSLKGLLLNRRQFPSPVVQSSPLPSIPAWQRNDPASVPEGDSELNKDPDENILTRSTVEGNGHETANTSSDTLRLPNSPFSGAPPAQSEDGKKIYTDQVDSSFSLSFDVESPDLTLNGVKENITET